MALVPRHSHLDTCDVRPSILAGDIGHDRDWCLRNKCKALFASIFSVYLHEWTTAAYSRSSRQVCCHEGVRLASQTSVLVPVIHVSTLIAHICAPGGLGYLGNADAPVLLRTDASAA